MKLLAMLHQCTNQEGAMHDRNLRTQKQPGVQDVITHATHFVLNRDVYFCAYREFKKLYICHHVLVQMLLLHTEVPVMAPNRVDLLSHFFAYHIVQSTA